MILADARLDARASHGCFETMRAYQGIIFRLDDHLDRLTASAQYLGTGMPNRRRLRRQVVDALASSGLQDAIVRVALLPRSHLPADPSIVVQPVPWPPAIAYRQGIALAVVPARPCPVSVIDPRAKYSARLGSVLTVIDAQVRRVDEALFLDPQTGSVTESTASNFGIIKHGSVKTPPCWLGLLAGITRQVIEEAAGRLGLAVEEIPLTRHDVYNAEEAFLSSTIKEVMPVTRIDGRHIGTGRPGPVTKRLRQAFQAIVQEELAEVTH